MDRTGKMISKSVTAILILVMSILAACTPTTPITFCHATGDAVTPYTELTITRDQIKDYIGLPYDFYPVPANGCPTTLVEVTNQTIAICHSTGNETDPYKEITVSVSGLNGHAKHAGDIVPVPAGGCPTGVLDITDGKITICHVTGSQTNPYNEITVNVNGLNGHDQHTGDIIPVPADGCPAILLAVNEGKITICHATGSATHPYNKITVSINGLNGHGKHAGDIIPAPAGDCPTTP
jgi:hypothetical protein